jgi:predicted ATPase/class 3 adenylate cyclase
MTPATATSTLTFLATDIQGSTELWEKHRAAMASALARHDQLLKTAIGDHGGRIFKNVGDGLFAVFEAAPPAVAAALNAQRTLLAAEWPTPEAIRVRMALHTGQAEPSGGDYLGPPVNRVARILAAGHGGQVLLSQTTERLAADSLPDGAALRDLGKRALKDLTEPERIFQLVAADLPGEFPPLRTLDARPNNLPAQITPLIGREQEIAEIRTLLHDRGVRLVTLLGSGGTGKTRLALQVAAEVIDDYKDGVWHVNLAPVEDPAILPGEILEVLGVKLEGNELALATLEAHLKPRELLLVLDNFEQLVEAAPLLAKFLHAAAQLNVLVTSQAALRIQGEHEYPLAPLPLPHPGQDDPDRLAGNEAVALFVQRARSVQPSFTLNGENAAAVGALTRQLDGLPLAIELAAARIKLFSPVAMLARLERQFEFLTSSDRDRPGRHRTLRAALDWSYGLLAGDERKVFQRMSVFDGGFALEAAEAVLTTPEEELDVPSLLESLIDKSLLRAIQKSDGESRFERLRTIRAYAAEKLEQSGETERWRRRHAEHFADLAEKVDFSRSFEPDARITLERIEHDAENLRAAMEWALGRGEAHLAVRLSHALPALWFTGGHLEEGLRWVERILTSPGLDDPLDRAKALNLHGRLDQVRGDNSPAVVARFEESLALFREGGHRPGIARALMNLGNVKGRTGSYGEARRLFEDSLEIYREIGDAFGISGALMNLGDASWNEGDRGRAAEFFEQARDSSLRGGADVSLAFALQYLGAMQLEAGDPDAAEALFLESQAVFRRMGARPGQAWSHHALARVAEARGDLERARELYCHALETQRELGYAVGMAESLVGIAGLDVAAGRFDHAAQLVGAAEALRKGTMISRSPLDRAARTRVIEQCIQGLGEEAFERERTFGGALPQAGMLALARGDGDRSRLPRRQASSSG